MTSELQQITLDDISLDVIRKDIKNIHLRVYSATGKASISAPLRVSFDTIRDFTVSKLSWIKKQQARFSKQVRKAPPEYLSLEEHYFNGQRYLLNVIYHGRPPKVELRDQSYIDLYVREGSDLERRRKVMSEWYRRRLKARIPVLIDKWQKIVGVKVNSWGIKLMSTRWGTCNIGDKRIWLNLELAKRPESCLEYIIVHEMTHLLERGHGRRYKAYMDKFMPEWRSREKELKNGPGSDPESR